MLKDCYSWLDGCCLDETTWGLCLRRRGQSRCVSRAPREACSPVPGAAPSAGRPGPARSSQTDPLPQGRSPWPRPTSNPSPPLVCCNVLGCSPPIRSHENLLGAASPPWGASRTEMHNGRWGGGRDRGHPQRRHEVHDASAVAQTSAHNSLK